MVCLHAIFAKPIITLRKMLPGNGKISNKAYLTIPKNCLWIVHKVSMEAYKEMKEFLSVEWNYNYRYGNSVS